MERPRSSWPQLWRPRATSSRCGSTEDRQLRWARSKLILPTAAGPDTTPNQELVDKLKRAQLRQEINIYGAPRRYPENLTWEYELALRLRLGQTARGRSGTPRRPSRAAEGGDLRWNSASVSRASSNSAGDTDSRPPSALTDRELGSAAALYGAGVLAAGLKDGDAAEKHLRPGRARLSGTWPSVWTSWGDEHSLGSVGRAEARPCQHILHTIRSRPTAPEDSMATRPLQEPIVKASATTRNRQVKWSSKLIRRSDAGRAGDAAFARAACGGVPDRRQGRGQGHDPPNLARRLKSRLSRGWPLARQGEARPPPKARRPDAPPDHGRRVEDRTFDAGATVVPGADVRRGSGRRR